MVKLTITANEADQRLDRFLRKYLRRAPLSAIYRMIRKDVKLNGKRAAKDTMLRTGDELVLYISEERIHELTVAPARRHTAKKQFKVIYEDDDVLIVDKPRGLLTHGDSHEKKNTLANQVCGYLQEKGEYDLSREKTFTPSPVNRLDRNTTGLVIFGKNADTLRKLTRLIRQRDGVDKYYLTIVCGKLDSPMALDEMLEKDHRRNISRVVSDASGSGTDARKAITFVEPVIAGKRFSLVEAKILTGRTHQIRLQLANAGFPLAGDSKYGNSRSNRYVRDTAGITTQLLHACRLVFADIDDMPSGLRGKTVESPLPPDFKKAEQLLVHERIDR